MPCPTQRKESPPRRWFCDFKFVKNRRDEPSTGQPQRMSYRDRSTVWVPHLGVAVNLLHARDPLCHSPVLLVLMAPPETILGTPCPLRALRDRRRQGSPCGARRPRSCAQSRERNRRLLLRRSPPIRTGWSGQIANALKITPPPCAHAHPTCERVSKDFVLERMQRRTRLGAIRDTRARPRRTLPSAAGLLASARASDPAGRASCALRY